MKTLKDLRRIVKMMTDNQNSFTGYVIEAVLAFTLAVLVLHSLKSICE